MSILTNIQQIFRSEFCDIAEGADTVIDKLLEPDELHFCIFVAYVSQMKNRFKRRYSSFNDSFGLQNLLNIFQNYHAIAGKHAQ